MLPQARNDIRGRTIHVGLCHAAAVRSWGRTWHDNARKLTEEPPPNHTQAPLSILTLSADRSLTGYIAVFSAWALNQEGRLFDIMMLSDHHYYSVHYSTLALQHQGRSVLFLCSM